MAPRLNRTTRLYIQLFLVLELSLLYGRFKMAANGLGLAEVVEIRELQPNPCTKDKLKN